MGKKRDDDGAIKMSNPLFDLDPTDDSTSPSPSPRTRNPSTPRIPAESTTPKKKPKMTKDGKAVHHSSHGSRSVAYAKDVPQFKADHGKDARRIFLIAGAGIGGCKPALRPVRARCAQLPSSCQLQSRGER
jgi:hypothetical protein